MIYTFKSNITIETVYVNIYQYVKTKLWSTILPSKSNWNELSHFVTTLKFVDGVTGFLQWITQSVFSLCWNKLVDHMGHNETVFNSLSGESSRFANLEDTVDHRISDTVDHLQHPRVKQQTSIEGICDCLNRFLIGGIVRTGLPIGWKRKQW